MSSELVPSPDDLFRAARYTECLSATEGDDSHEAHLLRARVYLQMDRAEDALTELSGISALEGDLAATAGALRCRALNMLRSWTPQTRGCRRRPHPAEHFRPSAVLKSRSHEVLLQCTVVEQMRSTKRQK